MIAASFGSWQNRFLARNDKTFDALIGTVETVPLQSCAMLAWLAYGRALRVHLTADLFHLAKDAQQIAAENFINLRARVAAVDEGLSNLWKIGSGIDALWCGAADAVKI